MTSRFDPDGYRWVVVRLARHTPRPVNDAIRSLGDHGPGSFAVPMLLAWPTPAVERLRGTRVLRPALVAP